MLSFPAARLLFSQPRLSEGAGIRKPAPRVFAGITVPGRRFSRHFTDWTGAAPPGPQPDPADFAILSAAAAFSFEIRTTLPLSDQLSPDSYRKISHHNEYRKKQLPDDAIFVNMISNPCQRRCC
ncbi:hypothetical protein [Leisingera thetidis]|uniref:hypothetical protein n=1 Tax=Leisingera thetidis TaxID=2930199 RepID=UPI0021F6CE70|nr:hypothetical protein [Leisingera thetidis]